MSKCVKKVNKHILDNIYYNDAIKQHTNYYESDIKSNVTIHKERIISIFFDGYIVNNARHFNIQSALTYDLSNGEQLYLLDLIQINDIEDKLNSNDFKINSNLPMEDTKLKDYYKNELLLQLRAKERLEENYDNFS